MITSKKTTAAFGIVLGMMMLGCYQSADLVPRSSNGKGDAALATTDRKFTTESTCGTPGGAKTSWAMKANAYNCHAYTRGALLFGLTNADGEPTSSTVSFPNGIADSAPINSDDRFIRVAYLSDAQAISYLPAATYDHSEIIDNTGKFVYATPDYPDYLYGSGMALNYNTACDYEYFAAIPDVTINGPTIGLGSTNNITYTFTLNKGSHTFFTDEGINRWTIPSGFHSESGSDGNTLIITPNTSGTMPTSGTYSVVATLRTDALPPAPAPCVNGIGINNLCGSSYAPVRTKNFSYTVVCSGKLDGGTLSTVNSVTYGTHSVVMDNGTPQLTWVLTSGSASYSTSNFGRSASITLSSGSASFHVYGGGCDQNFTFYPH